MVTQSSKQDLIIIFGINVINKQLPNSPQTLTVSLTGFYFETSLFTSNFNKNLSNLR
jgi:hypothetical protein